MTKLYQKSEITFAIVWIAAYVVLSGLADQLITLAKRGDLAARRTAIARLYDEDVVRKLFDEIADKYKDRQGGYTRILKLGPRRGDAAPMALLELV